MIDLSTLKTKIETKQAVALPIIFVCEQNYFVAKQYYTQLALDLNKELEQVNDIGELCSGSTYNLFDIVSNESLTLFICDTFDTANNLLLKKDNLIIVCKKISAECEKLFQDSIVKIPKLEKWQIQDYVYTNCEGVDTAQLDTLITACDYDIYRLDQECSKLHVFQKQERPYVFSDFVSDGIFSDISSKTIFDLTSAVIKKDRSTIYDILSHLDTIDVEPLGLLKVLTDNFRDIIRVQLGMNVTPEYCERTYGWKSGKYWAIKYSCGVYTKQQLVTIFKFLSRLQIGEVPDKQLISYILSHIINT